MGAIFGWGKRLATVDRTRLQPTNPAFAGADHTLGGTVSRYGRQALSLAVEFENGGEELESLPGYAASTFLYRYIASPSPDVPDIEQLFELGFSNVSMRDVRRGTGQLKFGNAENEDLDLLGEVEVTGGYAYQRGWTTERKARLLRDFTLG